MIVLKELCDEHDLTIANEAGDSRAEANSTFRSNMGGLRRIDYIIYGRGLDMDHVEANARIDLGSDHRALMAWDHFEAPPQEIQRKRKKIMRGWNPGIHDQIKYHGSLKKAFEDSQDHFMSSLIEVIKTSAERNGTLSNGPHGLKRPERSAELKEKIRKRRYSREPIERCQLSKDINQFTRQELRKWRTMGSMYLLEKFEDTKQLQKIILDPVKESVSYRSFRLPCFPNRVLFY